MRKNVNSTKEREPRQQRNAPMWYTAASEYSRKKRLAERLTACQQEIAAFEKRIRMYSQEIGVHPPLGLRPSTRSKSPNHQVRGCVVPTPRVDGGASSIRLKSRSKSPAPGLRNAAASTARPLGTYSSTTNRGLPPSRVVQRKIYLTEHEQVASVSTFKRRNLKVPPVSLASSSASQSDDDNENQPQIVQVSTQPSQRSTHIAQLIMVEPSTKTIGSVPKQRMSSATAPSQSRQLSKAPQKAPSAAVTKQQRESVEAEEVPVETEQQEPMQETEPDTAAQSEPHSEPQSDADNRNSEPEQDVENLEEPDIQEYHCYPNDCQRRNFTESNTAASMICGECGGNGSNSFVNQTGGNVLASCSVTEEHFISFNSDTELQKVVNSACIPQYGISHYMYPGNDGQANWNNNMQYSYPTAMMQPQAGPRMSYGCNRHVCRQQQQQQSQNNMCNIQQQIQQRQQQQMQQEQQQLPASQSGCLTELLAQQLQQQMKQAQEQIAQVQMQLYNVCNAANKLTRPSADAAEGIPQLPELDESPSTSAQSTTATTSCRGKTNVTFCTSAATGRQSGCCNNESPVMMPLGFGQVQAAGAEQMNQQQQQQFFQQQQQQLLQQQQFLLLQQQQSTFQQSAPQCSSNPYWTPCRRQRYAQMRFMMPRCCRRSS